MLPTTIKDTTTMNNPSLYTAANRMQRRDAEQTLKEYLTLVQWRPEAPEGDGIPIRAPRVLDVGCGAGDVTCEVLRPRLPAGAELVGADVSEGMVVYAKGKYGEQRGVQFRHLDVGGLVKTEEWGHFDHVFSFYCLHWVQDQRRAMSNIHSLLRPGGDMLVTFLASNPIYDVYLELASITRWKPYMKDVSKFISPYHKDKQPDKTIRSIMQKTGFKVEMCKCVNKAYTFQNLATLQKSVTAVCPFVDRIPDDLKEEYFADYVMIIRKMKFLEENNNMGEESIHVPYTLIVLYAYKPI